MFQVAKSKFFYDGKQQLIFLATAKAYRLHNT